MFFPWKYDSSISFRLPRRFLIIFNAPCLLIALRNIFNETMKLRFEGNTKNDEWYINTQISSCWQTYEHPLCFRLCENKRLCIVWVLKTCRFHLLRTHRSNCWNGFILKILERQCIIPSVSINYAWMRFILLWINCK